MNRRILSEIAKTIRKEGDEIAKEPVPEKMAALLAQLEGSAAQQEAPQVGKAAPSRKAQGSHHF